MSDSLTSIAGVLVAEKLIGANLNYSLDYTADMQPGDAITNSVWVAPPGLTLTNASFTNNIVTVDIGGGAAGEWYAITNLATGITGAGATPALVYAASIRLYVKDDAALGAGLNLPFPSILAALATIRRDRLLYVSQIFFPGIPLEDDYLLEKLSASTALIQRQLRVYLVPTEMIPNTATQDEINALTAAGNVVVQEPAYDYNPEIFIGNTWGFQPLRQRPIIAVHSMQFVYPTPGASIFTIPSEWIRLDKKYGTLNLLPVQTATMLPLNAFILSALGGGRTVPNFIEIRYRAGLENVAQDWPDILDVILKATVLSIVEDMFIPSSASSSVSADGLSQTSSLSLKMEEYQQVIDRKINIIKSAMFGIVMAVI